MPRILPILLSALFLHTGICGAGTRTDWYYEQAVNSRRPDTFRITCYDSIIKTARPAALPRLLLEKGRLQQKLALYDEASATYSKALALNPDNSDKARLNLQLGRLNSRLGRNREALKHFLKVLDTPKADSLQYIDIRADAYISTLFLSSHTTTGYALDYLKRAQNLLGTIDTATIPDTELRTARSDVANARGLYLLLKRDFAKAIASFKLSREFTADSAIKILADINIGLAYHLQGEHDIAMDCYNNAISHGIKGYPLHIAVVNMADMLLKTGQTSQATKIIEHFDNEIRAGNNLRIYIAHALNKAEAYKRLHRYPEAIEEYDKVCRLRDSISSSAEALEMAEMANSNLNSNNDRILKNTIDTNRRKTWVIALLAVIIAAICITAIKTRRKKRRLGAEMRDREIELAEKETKILNLEAKIINLNNIIENIRQVVTDGDTPIVEQVSSILRENPTSRENLFEKYFDRANEVFFNKLLARHPTLTNSELKMAAYILKGLSSKEIAEITCRSVRTVESIKYTLRKKLCISEPTASYLRSLTSG